MSILLYNGFELALLTALCPKESRVYPGYHPQNERKYLGVFPGHCILKKKVGFGLTTINELCFFIVTSKMRSH
jgi:hypothetical protein